MESRGVVVVVDEYSDHQQQQQHLSMAVPININIPPGFRFVPSDIELIECYLKKRMISASSSASLPEADGLIVDFDIYSCNPWELPHHLFRYPSQQREMYFFSPTHPLHSSSSSKRCDRTTGCGVWHCNGQDNRIVKNGVVIGHTTAFKFEMIDQPVASEGAEKAIKGSNKRSNDNGNGRRKTDWLMHEYRLPSANALVLCNIYENKTTAAAAASSSSRKQQEHQQHHLLNTKRSRTVEEEEPLSVCPLAAMPMPSLVSMAYSNAPALDHMIQVPKLMQQQQQLLLNTKRRRTVEEEEPLSVRPLAAMPMPSLASMAYSNAPALGRMIQVPKLMQQQQLLLNTKRRRTVEEEEPVPVCPLAAVLPPSSEIKLMASAPVPAAQQQQQQVEDADSDFALALEQLLEEAAAAERDMSCGNAAAVPVPAVMPNEATFLSSWQNMPEFPSLQQKCCGSAPLTPTSTLTADKEFSADVAAAAAAAGGCFEQEATESDKRPPPLLKRSQVDETAIEQLPQQQQQQQEQGLMNTLDSTEAVSGTTEDEDMESLLKNISFDDELGSLPPLDFLTPGDELSMATDKFFDGVEDYPF